MFNIIEAAISQAMIKRIEAQKVLLWNTNTPFTTKFKKGQHTTEHSYKWGTLIRYPPNAKRDYPLVVFVSFIEDEIKKKIENEQFEIKCFNEYLVFYNEVLNENQLDDEPLRLYKNFLRRQRNKKVLRCPKQVLKMKQ